MLRQIHKIPGLVAALLVVFLAMTGTILSVLPALNRASTPPEPNAGLSIATLAGRIVANYPGVERIRKTPSGKVVAFYYVNNQPASALINPATGKALRNYEPSGFLRWMKNLHRSLFFGRQGRATAGIGAGFMVLISLSGVFLIARRMGGWQRFLSKARGTLAQRLHVDLARVAVLGLLLSSLTGVYLTLTVFAIIPDGMAAMPVFPAKVNGGPTLPVAQVTTLQDIKVSQLRELDFPYPNDPTDVYTLSTASGDGYIDQSTGQMLVWQPLNTARKIYEFFYMLHTGRGLWWLGLILGFISLSVPVLTVTGTVIWWKKRRALPKFTHNIKPQAADTIILVGSEGGSTWGFARTLHDSLTAAGHKVHTGPMSSLALSYRAAKHMFLFTATYGDGETPQSAKSFMSRLANITETPNYPVTVLGFGDRQFPQFCKFSSDVEQALSYKGWWRHLPLKTIDRQSVQEFHRWGQDLSAIMAEDFELRHVPHAPRSHELTLISRDDYGDEVQAPTSILRFALPKRHLLARLIGRAMTRFNPGDLVGIVPPGSPMPRYYSLATSTRDGVLEICVRKHAGGLCSGYLHEMQPGGRIAAFIKPNPEFRPRRGKTPVILIGAGTGVGPLAGFIRANGKFRPMHLYFGGRDPNSDFLYHREMNQWLIETRLTRLCTAFSRVTPNRAYVQDSIRQDSKRLRAMIRDGAQILVCGGRDMASGVMEALGDVLAPMGLEPATLKAQGRYVEDVY